MNRTILHLDLDAFFCAVEENHKPALRGERFAVGGSPTGRGVVSSCSYPARAYGVHSAMPMAQAVRQCPGLIVVPPNFDAYRAASRKVMAKLGEITPLIEQISIDEAFLDVTPLDGEKLARRLQAEINAELGLPCSFGVATNKLVAKIANNVGKDSKPKSAPPNAICVVPPSEEAAFLAPLPVRDLWGVGPKTAAKLESMNIRYIGDLARWRASDLAVLFGKSGAELAERAAGRDDRPVEPEHEAKSISRETTFSRDVSDGDFLRKTLRQLSEGVGWRVRKAGLRGNTIKLKIRWSDFTTLSRQQTLAQPTDDDVEIERVALALFQNVWRPGTPVRLIGVGVSGFDNSEQQLELWANDDQPNQPPGSSTGTPRPLQSTLDELRNRFGEGIVQRGSDLKRKR